MKPFLFICLVFNFLMPALAENEHLNVPRGTQFEVLHAKQNGRDYLITIHLPWSYGNSPDKSYPILYHTDPQWQTNLIAHIANVLSYDKHIEYPIIVGITYPGKGANYMKLRTLDMTPTDVSDGSGGGADAFLDFMEEALIPHIESKYRVNTDKRAFLGASTGGLLSLYAMYQKPELFSGIISSSPSVSWDSDYLIRRNKEFAATKASIPTRVFVSWGDAEHPKHIESIKRYLSALEKSAHPGLELKSVAIPEAGHGSSNPGGMTRGMRWVFE